MRMLLKLIRLNLNIAFGISVLKYRFTKEKKKLWEPILVIISTVFGIGMLLFFFSIFMIGSFYIFKKNGQGEETILAVAFLGSQFFLLFFGIFHILSSFYFSKDMDFLVALPIKPYQILGSKFITIMVNEYLIALPLLIPALLIYGIGMGASLLYWLKGILCVLMVPVIPLALSSFLVILLMRFINIKRSKDMIVVMMSFIGLFFGIGTNFYVQKMMHGDDTYFDNIIQMQQWLIETIGRRFPPSIWATYGLSKQGLEGLGFFLLFIGVSLLLFTALLWTGNKVFYKGLMSGDEGLRKTKALSLEKDGDRHMKIQSPLAALFWREWKLLLRTPVFLMNGLAGIIMMPVMAVMTALIQEESSISKVVYYANDPQNSLYVGLGGLALMILASSMNIVSSTAVSREGQTFWISKVIPVSAKMQVMAKLIHGLAISVIGILIIGIIMAAVLKYPLVKLPLLVVLATMAALVIIVLDLIIDLIHPKLDWTNPHEAVKTNLNGLFGLIAAMLFMGFLSIVAVSMALMRLPEYSIYAVLFILNTIILIPGLILLNGMSERRYKSIEM